MKTAEPTHNQTYAMIIEDDCQKFSPFPALGSKGDNVDVETGASTLGKRASLSSTDVFSVNKTMKVSTIFFCTAPQQLAYGISSSHCLASNGLCPSPSKMLILAGYVGELTTPSKVLGG
ncbi:hypothetical protein MTR67_043924 [Solanum verrucosum]|uniref:Uncharacterized protein n=1 Tax=Solanum verrucosum TaxID=315347 RepID=A0AAF0ZVK7_SOLVR|nr:hypothetical protein MTR67_043924 [Solanum verrucosum]